MKMNVKSIIAVLAAFAMVLSCSKVDELGNDSISGEEHVVTGELVTISAVLSDNMTKVSFTPEYDEDGKPQSLALAWEAGDKLRIYNHADKTKYEDFELTAESVGAKKGYFTGVLPVADSYDVEVINGDVDYAVQVQPADGVTTSLKYMATATDVADVTSLTFTDYSSVLAITAKLPEGVAAVVGSVDITASEAIFNAGKTLTISLTEKGDAGTDGILHLFANLPQGNHAIAEGTTLLMHFNAPDTDHTVYTRYVELDESAFTAGRLNTINVNASQSDKHAGLATCDGTTAEKAYLIGDKYQMQAMHDLMEADATTYFKMVDDVDLGGIDWEPLNLVDPWSKGIYFDGADHTVSNFSSNAETYDYPSFAGILNGTVCNVTFDKANVQCAGKKGGVIAGYFGHKNKALKGHCINVVIKNSVVNSEAMAGVFAAQGDNVGTLSDCSVIDTEITSTSARVGGFIGSLVQADKISGCTAENVTVSSDSYLVGGFAGNVAGGVFENCTVSGSVTSKSYKAGGFIGNMDGGTLTNCSASEVEISAGQYAGGLIGNVADGTLTDCSASGSVTSSSSHVGGLIGNMEAGTLTGCSANVVVTAASYYTGGLVGYATTATLADCHATGKVVSNKDNYARTGGLVGEIHGGSVTGCSATGDVDIKGAYAGGLIGVIDGTMTVSTSYAAGHVAQLNAQNYNGVLIGWITSASNAAISNCYTSGKVSGNNYCGGFTGFIEGKTIITNCYSNSIIEGGKWSASVFSGNVNPVENLTLTGFIGWNVSNRVAFWYEQATALDGNYMGTDGTISEKAREYDWDETVWDLSGDVPVLK